MSPEDYRDELIRAQREALFGLVKPPPSLLEGEEDEFETTFYCPCPTCCGHSSPEKGGHGLTASGRPPEEGVTIAADWSVLPRGAEVEIEGLGRRRVMDTGSAIKGKKIDVFMKSHEAAKAAGRKRLRVKRIRKDE